MDDTVILATSRSKCIEKAKILIKFCNNSGMIINENKTKFMVINGNTEDKKDLIIRDDIQSVSISHCTDYNYLGCWFTSDGKLSSAIQKHATDKHKHYMKLVSFLKKNHDFPFVVKQKVMDAAFFAAILYGCESWFSQIHIMNQLYVAAIKALLVVRRTMPNLLCLLELGYPPLVDLVKQKQKQFFQKIVSDRNEMKDDPFIFCIDLAISNKTSQGLYIKQLLGATCDYKQNGLERIKTEVKSSEKTKYVTYVRMNPVLDVHAIYKCQEDVVPEHTRVTFSQFRLSSHCLRVETGRWSRTPRESRHCTCVTNLNQMPIQDEEHVVSDCSLSKQLRQDFPNLNYRIPNIFQNDNLKDMCEYIYKLLQLY